MKVTTETGDQGDERKAKHARNKHSKLLKRSIKNYYHWQFKESKNKF